MLRQAWERNADDWIRWAREPLHDSYWRFHRDRFLELVPAPGRLTLDIGYREGRLSRDLAALGHTVVGIDPSPKVIAAARELSPELEFLEADAADLPIESASAELAVAALGAGGFVVEALHEIPGTSQRWLRYPLFLHLLAAKVSQPG